MHDITVARMKLDNVVKDVVLMSTIYLVDALRKRTRKGKRVVALSPLRVKFR